MLILDHMVHSSLWSYMFIELSSNIPTYYRMATKGKKRIQWIKKCFTRGTSRADKAARDKIR